LLPLNLISAIQASGHEHKEAREGASTTPVPLFALFEFVGFRFGNAPWANNAKGGTLHVEFRNQKPALHPR